MFRSERIFFCFCRAKGSEAEDRAARSYLGKARMNVLDPTSRSSLPFARDMPKGAPHRKSRSPRCRKRPIAVAQAIMDRLPGVKEAA